MKNIKTDVDIDRNSERFSQSTFYLHKKNNYIIIILTIACIAVWILTTHHNAQDYRTIELIFYVIVINIKLYASQ